MLLTPNNKPKVINVTDMPFNLHNTQLETIMSSATEGGSEVAADEESLGKRKVSKVNN